MAVKKSKGAKILFWTASIVVLLDILTKSVVRAMIPEGNYVEVLPFLRISHIQNAGITFGMMQIGALRWVFVAVALAVAVAIAWSCRHKKIVSHFLAWGLIMGGAIGNALDRIFIGTVTDFAHVGIKNFDLAWPAFNIADSALTIGAIIILWHSLRKE